MRAATPSWPLSLDLPPELIHLHPKTYACKEKGGRVKGEGERVTCEACLAWTRRYFGVIPDELVA